MNMNNQINNQKEIKNTNVKTLSIIINGEIRNVVLDDFKKEKITFGRDPTNDIVLSSHFVSKFHGYFELKNNELIIVDNESKNGLIINEEKVNQRVLEDNDYIKLLNHFKYYMECEMKFLEYAYNKNSKKNDAETTCRFDWN